MDKTSVLNALLENAKLLALVEVVSLQLANSFRPRLCGSSHP